MPNTVFERVRDALLPLGIECEIGDRRKHSVEIVMRKDGGKRTLFVSEKSGDPRVPLNCVSDAKRICREAGWIEVAATEPEIVPIKTYPHQIKDTTPALGAALEEALTASKSRTIHVIPEAPAPRPAIAQPIVRAVTQVEPPTDKIVTGRIALYARTKTRGAYFSVVLHKNDMTAGMGERIYAPSDVRPDRIVLAPTDRGTRHFTNYGTGDWRSIGFEVEDRHALLHAGEFGMTDCLVTIKDDAITVEVPPKDQRKMRQYRGAALEAMAYETPDPSDDPITVLRNAKEQINAMRKKVPGLVLSLSPEGDIEFTLKI